MNRLTRAVHKRFKAIDLPISHPSPLTTQEIQCLRWCKEGKTNREIGEILCISEKTVEYHLGNVMRKFGANNRIVAVISAIKAGVIPL